MKFFKLSYLCLLSFIIIPFTYGMDYFPDDPALTMPSSSSSSLEDSSESSGKIERVIGSQHTYNSGTIAILPTQQKMEQDVQLTKKLNLMRNDLIQFNTVNQSSENTSPQQKELAEKLKINLKILESPNFEEINYLSEPLKNDTSTALEDYHKKELEKERKLNTIITSVRPTESINRPLIKEIPRITIKETIPLLSYPFLTHPLVKAFTYINMAIDNNKEDFLIKAIQSFQDLYPNFKITSTDFFRVKYADLLKQNMFKYYLWDSTQTLEIIDETSQSLPFLLNEIAFHQELQNANNNQELKTLLNVYLLEILNRLKQTNPMLNKNIDLIQEIFLRTRLNKTTMQACLLLLNKVGNFYPQIKSDLAITIIDDIAANYFTLLEQSQSQTQNSKLIVQAIQLLTFVPFLEPLFSERLHISDIDDDELEDYLEKITLLELNDNPSPAAKQKLQKIEADIFKETNERSERAAAEARKAKVKTEEKLKTKKEIPQLIESLQKPIQSIAPAMNKQHAALSTFEQQMQEETDEFWKNPSSSNTIYNIQRKITNILFKKWDIQPDDYINLENLISKYKKEKPVFLGEVTIQSAYSTLKKIEDLLKKKDSLHGDYLATLSNQELVSEIKSLAFALLSSSKTPINDKALEPIFKYTDQLITNKAATGEDGVIKANHFINIAETIDLLRKIFHTLEPQDDNNHNNVNERIQLLIYKINNRDKNELIQQIKERKGRFNHPEKNIIKDIINDYYFSSYAHSYIEPLFAVKNSILAAIEEMEPQQNIETIPVIVTDKDQPILPSPSHVFNTLPKSEPSTPPVELQSITPAKADDNGQQVLNIILHNRQEQRSAAQPIPQPQINQTPSFWENISNAISSWFDWFFWGPL